MSVKVSAFVYGASGLAEPVTPQIARTDAQTKAVNVASLDENLATLKGKASDVVTISKEAYEKQAQAAKKEPERSLWETRFHLKAGGAILKNGNRREVALDGDSMTIMEYDGGRLVRKETGVINGDRMIRDIELYDENGRVSQKSHAELVGLGDENDLKSQSIMTREMQWFENGELVRSLHDKTTVDADYQLSSLDPGPMYQAKTLDELAGRVTEDAIKVEYFGRILEYANGKISRSATIENSVDARQVTNRSDEELDHFVAHRTREESKSSGLTVSMQTYDADGKLVRSDDFKDQLVTGGEQNMSLTSSWYNGGELVKRSSGTFTADARDKHLLQRRASIYRTLGLEEEDYSATKPLSASGLLARPSGKTATDGSAYLRGVTGVMNGDGYDPGQYFKDDGRSQYAHDMRFVEETFVDGELRARSEDRRSARVNPYARQIEFKVAAGLTEGGTPELLSKASHTRESYEDGRLKTRAVTNYREFTQENERGIEEVKTAVSGSIEGPRENAEVHKVVMGGMIGADNLAKAAQEGMSRTSDIFTWDFRGLMSNARDVQSY